MEQRIIQTPRVVICLGLRCRLKGATARFRSTQETWSVQSGCLNLCSFAPVVICYPQARWYGPVHSSADLNEKQELPLGEKLPNCSVKSLPNAPLDLH